MASLTTTRKAAKNASNVPDVSNSNRFSSLAVEGTVEVNDSNVSSAAKQSPTFE